MKAITNPKNDLSKVPQIMWNDRTKKDLSIWKNALLMAENPINPVRFYLYSLYADSILDPHLASVMSKRILAVTNTKLVFSEAECEDDENIENLIESKDFEKLLVEILNSKFYGYSLIQTDFVNMKVELIDRRYVKPEKSLVIANVLDHTGTDYSTNGYQNTCLGIGHQNDLGLLLIASQFVILKKGNIADWATFNERFATPFRYTTLPVGATNQQVSDSKQQLADMGANGYGVFPKGSEMMFVESKSSGNNTNYGNFVDFCNAEISKLFLGQTMTTEDGSSMSQAKVHKEVEDKISRADKKFVEKILNTDVRRLLIAQGVIPENSKAKFKFRDEEEEVTLIQQADIWLKANGISPIDKNEFSERFGVIFANKSPDPEPPKEEVQPKKGEEKNLKFLERLLTKLGFFQ